VSEACHMASVLSHGAPPRDLEADDETVEVEVDDTGLLRISLAHLFQKEDTDDGVVMVQTRVEQDRLGRWHRLLMTLQRQMVSQPKPVRLSHINHLRARLLHIVNPQQWTEEQDQFNALLIGMSDDVEASHGEVDMAWLGEWGTLLEDFMPGIQEHIVVKPRAIAVEDSFEAMPAVDAQPKVLENDVDRHVREENEERACREAEQQANEHQAQAHEEEVEYYRQAEDQMRKYQAAQYQAWEDWELQDPACGPPPVRDTLGASDLQYSDYQHYFQKWCQGAMSGEEVRRLVGEEAYEMMQVHYVAEQAESCLAKQDEQEGVSSTQLDAQGPDILVHVVI
ncbi:NLRC3, partial [Symbiodinium sp. CCMP2456]